jgi:tetratricopeptide (TPR) repeat protein
MKSTGWWLVLVSCASAQTVAFAQNPPGTSAEAEPGADAAYGAAAAHYRAGDYDKAIEQFERAYALTRAPGILFNIAQSHRLAGRCAEALRYYDETLLRDPNPPNKTEILERIAQMQRCDRERRDAAHAEDPAPTRGVQPAVPIESQPRRSMLPSSIALAGAGTVVVGAGVYAAALVKFRSVESSCPCAPGTFSGWERATTASYVLMGAGGAVALAGLAWWWATRSSEPVVAILPAPSALYVTGRF